MIGLKLCTNCGKYNMADIMIDIESLDTGPDCVILTIGAVLPGVQSIQ